MLEVSTIVIVTGEGGSGGALGLAIGDRILMQEFAIYGVIPPEGCAAILWRDAGKKVEAAEALKLLPVDLMAMKNRRRDRAGTSWGCPHRRGGGGTNAARPPPSCAGAGSRAVHRGSVWSADTRSFARWETSASKTWGRYADAAGGRLATPFVR